MSKHRWPHICWFCNGYMIWGGDHTFEDYGREGDGIIANLTCAGCGALALFHSGDTVGESVLGWCGESTTRTPR